MCPVFYIVFSRNGCLFFTLRLRIYRAFSGLLCTGIIHEFSSNDTHVLLAAFMSGLGLMPNLHSSDIRHAHAHLSNDHHHSNNDNNNKNNKKQEQYQQ